MPARAADQPFGLQHLGRFAHALAAHAEHVREPLVRRHPLAGLLPVQGQQQAATQLLQDRVVAVAGSRLASLRDQRLGVAKEALLDGVAESKPVPDRMGADADTARTESGRAPDSIVRPKAGAS